MGAVCSLSTLGFAGAAVSGPDCGRDAATSATGLCGEGACPLLQRGIALGTGGLCMIISFFALPARLTLGIGSG